jgi:hypothetical protein
VTLGLASFFLDPSLRDEHRKNKLGICSMTEYGRYGKSPQGGLGAGLISVCGS